MFSATEVRERVAQLDRDELRINNGSMTVRQFLSRDRSQREPQIDTTGEAFVRTSFPLASDCSRFIRNALSPFQPSGDLISGRFVEQLEFAFFDAPVRRLATVERVEKKDFEGGIPTIDDTASEAQVFAPDQLAPVADDVTTLGVKSLKPLFYSTGLISVSRVLIEDAPERLGGLPGILGGRLARGQNRVFTNGYAGVGGLIQEAYAATTSASPTAFTIDEALSLPSTVPGDYLESPKCGWMGHPSTWLYVKSLKDGAGRYLWKASGAGDWPFFKNKHMPTIAAGNVALLFGDFSRFHITDFGPVSVDRLTERRAEFYEDLFQSMMLTGAVTVDAGSHPIVSLTIHS